MEPGLLLAGVVAILVGSLATFHYKLVHELMFTGSVFSTAPPQFVLFPFVGAIGIGVLFVILGFIG